MNITRLPSLLAGTAALLLASAASAQLLSYDGFGNGPRPDLAGSTGGSGWASAWADVGTDPTTVGGAGLDYLGLSTTPGAAVTPVASGVYPSTGYQRAFAALPAGTTAIYVSFLMRDDAGFGAWGGLSFGQYPQRMSVGSPLGYYTYGLMTSQGLVSLASKPLVQGETTLVIVKIASNAVGSGVVYGLYLDPTIGSPEPSFPAASFAIGQTLPTALTLDNGTGFTTDEIRVGTTWAAVLPAPPAIWTDLGFAKPGITGAPHLNGSGPMSALSLNSLLLTNANPSANTLLVIGFSAANAPLAGGVLVPEPIIVVPWATDAAGSAIWQVTVPAGVPTGLPVLFQHWIEDPAATFGYSASNGLRGVSQ